MAHQQMEHETGLLLFFDDNTHYSPTPKFVIAPDSPRLPPSVLAALRSLRDHNPSLLRKLNHGVDTSSAMDESLGYWNRYQQIVIMSHDNSELIGVNLGGLMVRLVNCIPFFQTVNEEKILTLKTINFGGTDVGMDNLCEGLKLLSEEVLGSISELYLGGCGIGCRKGITYLKEVIGLLSENMTTLDLRYNDLEGQDWVLLEAAIIASASNLNVLHLEGNYCKSEGAAAIGTILSSPTSNLKELYLGANQIDSMGAKSLADGLRNNTSLEKLYLEGNSIGDEGANALRDVLLDQRSRQCKVLEHLYVDNNGLGKESATSLGRAVNSETMIDGSLFDG